jgi:osmotically-inducible protein OsmY
MDFADGTLLLEGEVGSIAAKKLALERAAAVPGVDSIVDRLRVAPAQRMGDKEIRAHVCDALLQEPAFREFAVTQRHADRWEAVSQPAQASGSLDVEVADGVVTLNGTVPGLDYKRLAGVLAWWVPGSRDVVNGIVVDPPEDDSDEMMAEAVRLVLDKDPFVDVSQVRIAARNAAVTLHGLVRTEAERRMAESDAWYVFGVDKVINLIEVRA